MRTPGGANSVQLAELEPLYLADRATNLALVASCQGENPPVETVEMLFDGDTTTKWLDFAREPHTNHSSWVEWQYLRGDYPVVINLATLHALRLDKSQNSGVDLEGVIVSWNPTSHILGFLDETGFAQFRFRPSIAPCRWEIVPDLRAAVQFGQSLPSVFDLTVVSLGELPVLAGSGAETNWETIAPFVKAELQGTVTVVDSRDRASYTLGLMTDRGRRMQSQEVLFGAGVSCQP